MPLYIRTKTLFEIMKNLLIVWCLLGLYSLSTAQNQPDKTLSPYFLVKSNSKDTDQMPLKHTSAEVNIAGVIADVKVRQVYVNQGKNTLEAIYVFPASTRAAVYAMTMTIGERKLIAKIEERQKARQDYEQAKQDGKTASLLEQQNPNVFQMNVANILPNDSITVELRYTELLIPTEGVYEFAYPTVVGPIYSETPESQTLPHEEWVSNPYLHEGEKPNYTFDLQTTLNAGMPIQEVLCTSHKVSIDYKGKNTARIGLKDSEKYTGNKDHILRYRLAGGQIQSGLLLYEGETAAASGENKIYQDAQAEKFFLLMMQPPKAPNNDQIPPREYVFIVDVSGSMHGFPLDISKKLLRELIGKLRPTDRFNVMLFESSNQMLSPESMPATQANIEKAIQVIDQQRGGGGTRLLPALQNALAFKETKDFSRTFVVVTDGYVTVEREAFDLIRDNLNQANLFAFGIGPSVNRFLVEGIAKVGMGEPFIVSNAQEAPAIAEKFRNYIQNPVLTNIQLAYNGFEVYDLAPTNIPDVFAERPIIVYGKYKGKSGGTITLTGLSGNKTYKQVIHVNNAEKDNNQALRYLWARKRIEMLDDYNKLSVSYWGNPTASQVNQMIEANPANKTRIEEVTQLGLKYNLLTAYTSFIAIDSEVRNVEGKQVTVKQPLPLPENVSEQAVREAYSPSGYGKSMQKYKKAEHQVDDLNPVRRQRLINNPTNPNYRIISDTTNYTSPEILEEDLSDPKVAQFDDAQYIDLQDFITQNLIYPAKAKQASLKGKVIIRFTVKANGKLANFKVLQSLSPECDAEAIRVLKLSEGKWLTAQQGGNSIDSKQEIEVVF